MADQVTIFYSWQSDLPSRTNRGLIKDALEAAAKAIRNDGSLSVQPRIDSDTQGLAGSPEIHDAIFDKIDSASCAVFDVSIVRRDPLLRAVWGTRRSHPNPNVLVELGYALKSMGEERVLTVLNLDSGGPEDLPFDIKQKRVISYTAGRRSKPGGPRADLGKKLDVAIRSILALGPRRQPGESIEPSVMEQIAAIPSEPLPNIMLRTKLFGINRGAIVELATPMQLYARLLQPPARNEMRFLAGKKQAGGLKHIRLTSAQLRSPPSFDSRLNLWEVRVNGNYFAEHGDEWVLTDERPSMW